MTGHLPLREEQPEERARHQRAHVEHGCVDARPSHRRFPPAALLVVVLAPEGGVERSHPRVSPLRPRPVTPRRHSPRRRIRRPQPLQRIVRQPRRDAAGAQPERVTLALGHHRLADAVRVDSDEPVEGQVVDTIEVLEPRDRRRASRLEGQCFVVGAGSTVERNGGGGTTSCTQRRRRAPPRTSAAHPAARTHHTRGATTPSLPWRRRARVPRRDRRVRPRAVRRSPPLIAEFVHEEGDATTAATRRGGGGGDRDFGDELCEARGLRVAEGGVRRRRVLGAVSVVESVNPDNVPQMHVRKDGGRVVDVQRGARPSSSGATEQLRARSAVTIAPLSAAAGAPSAPPSGTGASAW